MEYNKVCTSTGCSQQVLSEVNYNDEKEINYYSHNQRRIVKLSIFGSKISDNPLCYYHMKEDMIKRGLLQPGKEVI